MRPLDCFLLGLPSLFGNPSEISGSNRNTTLWWQHWPFVFGTPFYGRNHRILSDLRILSVNNKRAQCSPRWLEWWKASVSTFLPTADPVTRCLRTEKLIFHWVIPQAPFVIIRMPQTYFLILAAFLRAILWVVCNYKCFFKKNKLSL